MLDYRASVSDASYRNAAVRRRRFSRTSKIVVPDNARLATSACAKRRPEPRRHAQHTPKIAPATRHVGNRKSGVRLTSRRDGNAIRSLNEIKKFHFGSSDERCD
ncbi:hypothetical protein [Burkholderia ubonensis]|uniref:hypothetical protein n=1 Tax=Burkholderia ubonensis TaxID=101571 RepID=UPI000A9944A0|nr:hypothetical protein [Burkholderia ubonensis]